VHHRTILGITLATILLFSMTASALAQEGAFSARILAKGKKSNMLLLVINSPKSTGSIHQIDIEFTKGSPVVAITRGWDSDKSGNSITLTAKRNDIRPGEKGIFIIRVSDLSSAAFEWSLKDKDGNELRSGTVSKIRVKEPPDSGSILPPAAPEVAVNKFTAMQGEQITITGKGYTADSGVIIYIDQQEIARTNTDSKGMFNTVLTIQNNIAAGLHLLKAVDSSNKSSLIQIMVEAPQSSLPPLQGGRMEVRIDKEEYSPGDLIRIQGSAVFDRPVSLQIVDPTGGIVCGANPPVNNKTLLWDATCSIPGNAVSGRYVLEAKQVPHKTTTVFNVKARSTGDDGGSGGTGGEPGEDAGPLKLSTDKEKYKVGDVVKITVAGARSQSLLDIILDGPGSLLDYKRVTVDQAGSYTLSYPVSGSESVGVWKISAKQKDAEQKKEWIVRAQFTVEAS